MAGEYEIESRMPAAEFYARTRGIVDEVDSWVLSRFAEVSRAHGAVPLVLDLYVVAEDEVDDIANLPAIREAGLPVLDLTDVYPRDELAQLQVEEWDSHPNARGHRLVAESLYEKLLPVLRAQFAGS